MNLGSWTDPALWGQHRAELLSRVKILLNLSRNPGQFAGTRLTLGMGASCLVVSELPSGAFRHGQALRQRRRRGCPRQSSGTWPTTAHAIGSQRTAMSSSPSS